MTRELEESRETVTCSVCVALFEDARVLSCSHSFCLHCLIGCQAEGREAGTTEVNCPMCRELTIPPLDDIPLLPPNTFANKVADWIRSNDRTINTQDHDEETENDAQTENQFFVGNLLPDADEVMERKSVWRQVVMAAAAPVFGCMALYLRANPAAVFVCVVLSIIAIINSAQLLWTGGCQQIHTFTCNSCRSKQSTVTKYKCGMCNDFSLCPPCFADDELSLRHHIFLKLKFVQRRQLPLGPVLKPQAFGLAGTLDYNNSVHGRAYIHTPDRLLRIDGIKCAFCGVMPIKGVRYKCGMCSNYDLCANCETHSHKIHNRSHVFMVLKHKAEINYMAEPMVRAQFY